MTKAEGNRNILVYRIYSIFHEPLFWGPVLVLSFQQLAGLSLTEIYYMEAAMLCICVLLDIPTGALADVIGRKTTLILGRIFLGVSIAIFASMRNPLEAWVGNILWAIGFTLQSGPDTSLLYETLKEQGREHEYKKIQGQAVGARLVLMAFTSLSVGVLAEVHLRLPLWLCVPFVLVPLVACFFLKEPTQAEDHSVQTQMGTLTQGVAFVLGSKEVRWMIGFAALIMSTSKVWFFTYNPYFELVGVPVAQLGVIFFMLNLVAWGSSHYAQQIEQTLGERRCVLVAVMCVGGPIILMAMVPVHPFAYLVLVQNVVRGFMRPFFEDYIHHHISAAEHSQNIRATVMSAQTTGTNIAAIAGLAGFGVLTGYLSLLNSMMILGLVCLMLGAMSYYSYIKRIT